MAFVVHTCYMLRTGDLSVVLDPQACTGVACSHYDRKSTIAQHCIPRSDGGIAERYQQESRPRGRWQECTVRAGGSKLGKASNQGGATGASGACKRARVRQGSGSGDRGHRRER